MVWEHPGRIADVEVGVETHGAYLQTVQHTVVGCLVPKEPTLVCIDDGFIIRLFQGMVRTWIDVRIFRIARFMHSKPMLALLAIAKLAEVGWNATNVK